jgi:hypothetical protein
VEDTATKTIPRLYETEEVPVESKIIHQKWEIPQIGFYWLIAELDQKEQVAFGYANLNDDTFAEWGYISIRELEENKAVRCRTWQPCTFAVAQERMQKRRRYRTDSIHLGQHN